MAVLPSSAPAPSPPSQPDAQDPPFILPESVELRESIVFARPPGKDLMLDLFLPKRRSQTAGPGIIYVHGGGWRRGNTRAFWRQAAHLASLGYPGITITYRFAPEHRYPAQIEDVQAGVRWLRARATEYGIDPARIGAAGGSAGGHLVALLGTIDTVVEGISSKVQAVAAFNGVFSFPTLETEAATGPRHDLLGGDPQLEREASPLHRADSAAAPTLLLHGTADTTVPFEQSLAYQRRLEELGVRVEFYTAKDSGHGFFSRPPHYQPTLERITHFFRDVLGQS